MPPAKVRSTVMPSITGKIRREGCRYGVRSTELPTSGGVLMVQGWDQRKFILTRCVEMTGVSGSVKFSTKNRMSLASSSYDLYRQSLTTGTTEFDKKLQQLWRLEKNLAKHIPEPYGSKDRYRIYQALFPITAESPVKLDKLLLSAKKVSKRMENEQKIAKMALRRRPYVVLSDSIARSSYGAGLSKLEEEVEEFMDFGFEPVGGVSVEGTMGHQAMKLVNSLEEDEIDEAAYAPSFYPIANDPTEEASSSSSAAAVAIGTPTIATRPKSKLVTAVEGGGGGGGSLSASGIQKAEGEGGSLRKRKRTQNLRKKSRRTSRR